MPPLSVELARLEPALLALATTQSACFLLFGYLYLRNFRRWPQYGLFWTAAWASHVLWLWTRVAAATWPVVRPFGLTLHWITTGWTALFLLWGIRRFCQYQDSPRWLIGWIMAAALGGVFGGWVPWARFPLAFLLFLPFVGGVWLLHRHRFELSPPGVTATKIAIVGWGAALAVMPFWELAPQRALLGYLLTEAFGLWTGMGLVFLIVEMEKWRPERRDLRFRHLFEHARDAIFLVDLQSMRIVDVNPQACRLLGYPRESLIGRTLASLNADRPYDPSGKTFARLLEQGEVRSDELHVVRSDGTLVPISFTASILEINGQRLIQSIVRDLTDIRRQEAELHQRARELSILLRTAQIAASSLDPSALAEAILQEVVQAFGADYGAVFVIDGESNALRLLSQRGHVQEFIARFQTIPLDDPSSIHARVTRTGEPMSLQEWIEQNNDVPLECLAEAPHAALIAPLTARGTPVGTLAIGYRSQRQFSDKEISLLTAIGQQVGVTVENAKLFARLQQRVQELTFLVDFGASLNGTQDLEETAHIILDAACSLVNAEQGALILMDASGRGLHLLAQRHLPEETVQWLHDQGHAFLARVFQGVSKRSGPIEVPDLTARPDCPRIPGLTWRQVCYLPLRVGECMISVIALGAIPSSDASRRLLHLLTDLAAVAIERARLAQAIRERAERLAEIARLTQKINALRDPDELLQATAQAARTLLGAEWSVLCLAGETEEAFSCAAIAGTLDGLSAEDLDFLRPAVRRAMEEDRLLAADQVIEALAEEGCAVPVEITQQTLLCAPLTHRARKLGALVIARSAACPFAPDDMELLSLFANHAAIAIRNTRLNQETEWKARQLQAIAKITAQITSTLDWDALIAQVAEQASELARVPRTILILHDPESDEMVVASVRGYRLEVPPSNIRFKRGEGLVGVVWETGRPLAVPRAGDDPRYIDREGFEQAGEWSVLMIPLIVGGRVIGILDFNDEAGRVFSAAEQEMLTLLANQVAIAIHNASLYDALRRYSEKLEAEVNARTADLQRALERAQEADRLKSAFLSTISHELRTPLAAIKGFASTLLQEDVEWDSKTQREFLSIIERESDQLSELINQLLDMSRLEAGMLCVEQTVCSLDEIVTAVADRLRVLTKSHVLRMALPEGLPLVYADQARIGQVLSNLVENAAKYSPEGTEIVIEAMANGKEVVVSVTDRGEGIPPEFHERIFERFFRIEDDHAHSGTGLGLAICRGIIEAHGGRVWVESTPGQGSTFRFTLPVAHGVNGGTQ